MSKESKQTVVGLSKENEPTFSKENSANSIDDLINESEATYLKITQDIVEQSIGQLAHQNQSKNNLKKIFTRFFILFLSIQYAVMVVIIAVKMLCGSEILSDTVLISYIASVFVETIGAVIVMVKYAFDSEQETKVLEILNSVIQNFQKFNQ